MKILVHRKDNIGDTVLTLPVLHELGRTWPEARIFYWGPDYIAPILSHYRGKVTYVQYRKAKHVEKVGAKLASLWDKFQKLLDFRNKEIDLFLYVGDGTGSYARQVRLLIRPRQMISFYQTPERNPPIIKKSKHYLVGSSIRYRGAEYQEIFRILSPLDRAWHSDLAKQRYLQVTASSKAQLIQYLGLPKNIYIGIHLSARRVRQRWPLDSFEQLIEAITREMSDTVVLVTWAPGRSDDLMHPGDDEAGTQLKERLAHLDAVQFCTTQTVDELLTVQSICTVVFCSDGGAMHTAGALGIRVVAMFGDSDPARWQPLGANQTILKGTNDDVRNISVHEAHRAITANVNHESR